MKTTAVRLVFVTFAIAGSTPGATITAEAQVCALVTCMSNSGPSGASTQYSGQNSQITWGTAASVSVDFGVFHGAGTADLSGFVDTGGSASAAGHGNTVEIWTFHDPTGQHTAGSAGLFNVTYTVSGTTQQTVGPDQNNEADLSITLWATTLTPGASEGDMGVRARVISTSGTYQFFSPIPFLFDIPFQTHFEYSITALVSKLGPTAFFDAHAAADFQDTATLTGFQAYDAATGAAIAGASLTSDSGVLYPLAVPTENPIPEPSTALLISGALAGSLLGRFYPRRTSASPP